jgi:hypothetical protein
MDTKQQHTEEPWKLLFKDDLRNPTAFDQCAEGDNGDSSLDEIRIVAANQVVATIKTAGKSGYSKIAALNNARRIVACVNACKRFTIEVLEAAASCGGITAEPTAELLMAEQKSDAAFNQLHRIREAIAANPEESTADEVRRVVQQRDKLLAAAKITVGDLMDSYRTHGTEWFLDATRDLRNAIAEIEATKS